MENMEKSDNEINFQMFVEWVSIPPFLRPLDLQTFTDFAKSINVCEKTLYNWKKRPDFWEKVEMEYNKEKKGRLHAVNCSMSRPLKRKM